MIELIVLQDCCTIQLTQGKNALIDVEDFKSVNHATWNATKRSNGKSFYAMNFGSNMGFYVLGLCRENPEKYIVDHKNRDGLDNRKSNLRHCTPQQNSWNVGKKIGSRFRFKGIMDHVTKQFGTRYFACLAVDGKPLKSDFFFSDIEAARAYDELAIKHYGEFACTNAMLKLYD